MPRLRFPLRRFRFSLQLVALTLTAACCALGLIASQARQQQLAVVELQELGAAIDYDQRAEEHWAPAWLRDLVGDDWFFTAVAVRLHSPRENLRSRDLSPAEYDRIVAAIRRLPHARSLSFNHTGVSDDDLVRFASIAPQIEEVYFNEGFQSRLAGSGLKHLATWPRLASLVIPFGGSDPNALTHLADFPALIRFSWGNDQLEAADFAAIARCRTLESLTLRQCRFLGEAITQLTKAPALKRVILHNTRPVHFTNFHWENATTGPTAVELQAGELSFQPDPGVVFLLNKDPLRKRYRAWLQRFLPGITVSS